MGAPHGTPVRYLLQWFDAVASKRRTVVVPTVNAIQAEQFPATSLRFPADPREPAYVENGPARYESIVLSGTSGYEQRQGTNRGGDATLLWGAELFEALRDFLKDWIQEAAARQNAETRDKNPPTLTLFATWEGIAWTVGNHKLSWRHTVQDGTLTYAWTLRLEAIGRPDDRQKPVDPLADDDDLPSTVDTARSLNERRMAAWRKNGRAAAAARAGAAPGDVDGPLSEPPVEGVDAATDRVVVDLAGADRELSALGKRVRGAIEDCQRAINRASQARRGVEAAFDFPATVFSSALSTVEKALVEIDETYESLTPDGALAKSCRRYEAALLRFKRSVERTFAKAGRVRVRAAEDGIGGPVVAERVRASVGTACVTRVLDENETLPSFALRLFGRRDLWLEIARLNRLSDPWRTGVGTPIGTGGFALLVPAEVGPRVPRDETVNVFGSCWRVDDDGQLVWRVSGFDSVEGIAAYNQAIAMRFRHVKNTLASAPECGVADVVGDSSPTLDLGAFLADLRAQILRDSRTSKVERLMIVREGDTVIATADITPANGEAQRVSVPVEYPEASS